MQVFTRAGMIHRGKSNMMYLLDILEYCIRGILFLYLCKDAVVIKNKYARQGKYIFFLLFVVCSLWIGNSKWLKNLLYGNAANIEKSSHSIVKVMLMVLVCYLILSAFYEGSRLLKLYLALLFETIIELSRFGVHCFWSLGVNACLNCLSEKIVEETIKIDTYAFLIKLLSNFAFPSLLLLYNVIAWITIRAIRKYRKNIGDISRQGISFLMLSPAVGMAFVIILRCMFYSRNGSELDYLYDKYQGLYVVVPIMTFLCLLSIVYSAKIYEELMSAQEEKSSLIFYKRQLSDMAEHVQEIERLYDKIRSVRHDMNNYIADMEQLLSLSMQNESPNEAEDIFDNMENGFYKARRSETEKYLCSMKTALDGLTFRYSTGNPVTDVITNRKYYECEKFGISFMSDFIYPEKLGIEAFDLGILMNNTLDNAIEACKKCENVEGIKINLHSYNKGRMFFIRIENSCNVNRLAYTQSGELKTDKEDEWMHGIGLKNIKSVVEKYYGTMSYEIRDEVFYMTVMLQGVTGD